jgi:sugar lactone lactonase YvrE
VSAAPSSLPTPVSTGCVFPEGPRWRDGVLWFSDMHGHEVRRVVPGQAAELVAVVDQPSGLGFLPDGTPLVVSMRARQVLRLDAGTPTVHADLSAYRGDFANDMLVDGEGRAYVGVRTHRRRGEPPAVDQLVLVHPDGSTELAADDVIGPNGTVLTPDGGTLIVAETQAHRITAFDRHPDGRLGRRRVFAQLGEKVFPDGITLDRSGAVWAATGLGGRCLRVAEGAEVLDQVELSDRWITACTLGGTGLSTLFLTTAATTLAQLGQLNQAGGDPHDAHLAWAAGLSQGAVEAVDVAVAGTGSP